MGDDNEIENGVDQGGRDNEIVNGVREGGMIFRESLKKVIICQNLDFKTQFAITCFERQKIVHYPDPPSLKIVIPSIKKMYLSLPPPILNMFMQPPLSKSLTRLGLNCFHLGSVPNK